LPAACHLCDNSDVPITFFSIISFIPFSLTIFKWFSTPIDYLEAATPESSGVLTSFGTLVPLYFFFSLFFSP
jgi:hypothetical protein